jgi:uroporphyrin-III C-methyltransferase
VAGAVASLGRPRIRVLVNPVQNAEISSTTGVDASTASTFSADAAPMGSGQAGASLGVASAALPRWAVWTMAVLAGACAVSLWLVWSARERLELVETALVKRQDAATGQVAEARALASQAEYVSRDSATKLALLEARVAETTLQRTQVEDLMQALARSRDENLLADVEAAIRVAVQQSEITGSGQALASALRQADERLARYALPRVEPVRRAVLQDLERLRGESVADLPTLAIRIDEVIRQVDDLPLLAAIDARRTAPRTAPDAQATDSPAADGAGAGTATSTASAKTETETSIPGVPRWLDEGLRAMTAEVWAEVRDLIRVTRVDDPPSLLLAPDQAYFLRGNLKLRLLNARLALMSRQPDLARADLREAQDLLTRYFDRSSRRVALASELLRQTAAQTSQLIVPRPDATLAALAAVQAGR